MYIINIYDQMHNVHGITFKLNLNKYLKLIYFNINYIIVHKKPFKWPIFDAL